jgi:hypothetical protein
VKISVPDVPVKIAVVDTVTKLTAEHAGTVLVGASHCGVYAVYLAAKAQARAVILNNAGVGLDEAGIGGLAWADTHGLPAAAADHNSCRIADGADTLAHGRISHLNQSAQSLGCTRGMTVAECAEQMLAASDAPGRVPDYGEARFIFDQSPGLPDLIGCDSISLLLPEDAGYFAVTASHGALLGGLTDDGAVGMALIGVTFSDAGVGKDDAGIARLAGLDKRNIPAATVDAMTARIGDARSNLETGKLSRLNECAMALGARPGMATGDFADLVRKLRSPS